MVSLMRCSLSLYILLMLAVALLCPSGPTLGQSAKPVDVLRVVEKVEARLVRLYEADILQRSDIATLDIPPRRPRHVYGKATEVFRKVQLLRQLNGLTISPLPQRPETEVQPGDVRLMIERIDRELEPVMPFYWVSDSFPLPQAKQNVTPTDVYQGLNRLSALLDGLGLPSTAPNDVYRVVSHLRLEIQTLYTKETSSRRRLQMPDAESGKTPADAFSSVYAFLEDLQTYVNNRDDLSIPGSIVMPARPKGRITPSDVLELANIALAEVGSVKSALSLGAISAQPQPASGKSPSDVYNVANTARAYVRALGG